MLASVVAYVVGGSYQCTIPPSSLQVALLKIVKMPKYAITSISITSMLLYIGLDIGLPGIQCSCLLCRQFSVPLSADSSVLILQAMAI